MNLDKRLLFIGAGILIALAFGFAFVLWWGNKAAVSPSAEQDVGSFPTAPRDTTTAFPTSNTAGQQTALVRNEQGTTEEQRTTLFPITNEPVAGAVILDRHAAGSSEFVRYASRNQGHLFDQGLTSTINPLPISIKTIKRVRDAVWAPNGDSTMIRYLSDGNDVVYTYFGTLTFGVGSSTGNTDGIAEFGGQPLLNNIITFAAAPDSTHIFYIIPTDGGSIGYVEDTETGTKKQIWASSLRSVTATWPNDDMIVVYMKPATNAHGVVWIVDPASGKARIVLGNLLGLAARMNPAGTKILYSMYDPEYTYLSLRVLDMKTGESLTLPIPTNAEKCAWGPNTSAYIYCAVPSTIQAPNYLERWYQGSLVTQDVLWRFDTNTGATKFLVDPNRERGVTLDIIDPAVSPREAFFVFRSREDSRLWAYELPRERATTTASTAPQTAQ